LFVGGSALVLGSMMVMKQDYLKKKKDFGSKGTEA